MTETDTDGDEIACRLTKAEMEERAERLREELTPLLEDVSEVEDGYVLTFRGEDILEPVTKHVRREAECCPFARYEIDIAPYTESIEVRVTGEGVDKMVRDGLETVAEDCACCG